MLTLYESWTNIKNKIDSYGAKLKYLETPNLYKISVVYNQDIYTTEIWINTDNIKGIDITQNNIDKQDFEDNYKSNSEGIYNETGVVDIGRKTIETTSQTKNSYKCVTIEVTAQEQEYDLGSIFTEFTIMVQGNENVVLKLNDDKT